MEALRWREHQNNFLGNTGQPLSLEVFKHRLHFRSGFSLCCPKSRESQALSLMPRSYFEDLLKSTSSFQILETKAACYNMASSLFKIVFRSKWSVLLWAGRTHAHCSALRRVSFVWETRICEHIHSCPSSFFSSASVHCVFGHMCAQQSSNKQPQAPFLSGFGKSSLRSVTCNSCMWRKGQRAQELLAAVLSG